MIEVGTYVAVYILSCVTPNYRYVGHTADLEDRIKRHRAGRGAIITRNHGVDKVLAVEWFSGATAYEAAREAEWEIVQKLRAEGYAAFGGGRTSEQQYLASAR